MYFMVIQYQTSAKTPGYSSEYVLLERGNKGTKNVSYVLWFDICRLIYNTEDNH